MAQVSDPGLLSCHMRQVHDSVHNLDPGSHGIDLTDPKLDLKEFL